MHLKYLLKNVEEIVQSQWFTRFVSEETLHLFWTLQRVSFNSHSINKKWQLSFYPSILAYGILSKGMYLKTPIWGIYWIRILNIRADHSRQHFSSNINTGLWQLFVFETSAHKWHYNDIPRAPWGLKSLESRLFVQLRSSTLLAFSDGILFTRGPEMCNTFPCHDVIMGLFFFNQQNNCMNKKLL